MKDGVEIVRILEAFDLMRSLRAAAQVAGKHLIRRPTVAPLLLHDHLWYQAGVGVVKVAIGQGNDLRAVPVVRSVGAAEGMADRGLACPRVAAPRKTPGSANGRLTQCSRPGDRRDRPVRSH